MPIDLWAPAKIKRLLALLRGAGAEVGLVYCWYSTIDAAGRIAIRQESPLHEGNVLEPVISSNFIGNGSSVLIRRDAQLEAGGFDAGTSSARRAGLRGVSAVLPRRGLAPLRPARAAPRRLPRPAAQHVQRPAADAALWLLVQGQILQGHPERARAVARSARDCTAWLVSDALSNRAWQQVAPLLWTLGRRHPGSALRVLIEHVLRSGTRRLVRRRTAETMAAERPIHFRSP